MKIHESLTIDVVMAAADRQMKELEDPGFCVACGAEHCGVEPDAREYPCSECGERKVFGAMEILMEVGI